ncbi:MAG: protein BatD [Hahellaceae bacterium]|nr:protein BatD [Hahellaceae bacterium]
MVVLSAQLTQTLRRVNTLFVLLTHLFIAQFAQAAKLEANVDRTEIHANESLSLNVIGEIAVDSAFSLFDLNSLNVKAPDTTELEKDFEVVDRQQNYKVQIINNVNESVINWTYTLMPKREGRLTIPALSVGDDTTQPIAISVLPEQSDKSGVKSEVYLETEVDTTTGYVQQQVLMTVRLFYANDLVRGELDHPDHSDALIRQLGKQREFSRYVEGRHYKVVERKYAVFAVKAGKLELSPLQFIGSFVEPRTGRAITRRANTQPITLDILPPPDSFSGSTWLPLQSYNLQQSWSTEALELPLGQTLTRTLHQQALGQEGVNLPPINTPVIDGLKFYSEPSQPDTQDAPLGVTGSRKDVQMIVATRPGVYQLPDIEVVWWDVVNNQERATRLPGRTITVTGDGQTVAAAPITASPAPPEPPPGEANQPHTLPTTASSEPPEQSFPATHFVWTGLFAAAWLITCALWYRDRNRRLSLATPVATSELNTETLTYRDMKKKAQADPYVLAQLVPNWIAQHHLRSGSNQMSDTLYADIRQVLNALQSLRYGPASRSGADEKIAREQARSLATQLLKHIEMEEKRLVRQNEKGRGSPLPDLYTP